MFADASVAAREKSMGIRGGRICLLFERRWKQQRMWEGKHSGALGICILDKAFGHYCIFFLLAISFLQRFELPCLTPLSACLCIHYCDIPLAVVPLSPLLKLFSRASACGKCKCKFKLCLVLCLVFFVSYTAPKVFLLFTTTPYACFAS
jgi:hypothetical protein